MKGKCITRHNVSLDCCANGDGRPICPPSRVLCRECMAEIGEKMQAILARLERRAASEEER